MGKKVFAILRLPFPLRIVLVAVLILLLVLVGLDRRGQDVRHGVRDLDQGRSGILGAQPLVDFLPLVLSVPLVLAEEEADLDLVLIGPSGVELLGNLLPEVVLLRPERILPSRLFQDLEEKKIRLIKYSGF